MSVAAILQRAGYNTARPGRNSSGFLSASNDEFRYLALDAVFALSLFPYLEASAMWIITLLSSLGYDKSRRVSTRRRRVARSRKLRIESMEPRIPLSASPLLLAEDAEPPVGDTDDQALIDSAPVEVAAVSIAADAKSVCTPIAVSKVQALRDRLLAKLSNPAAIQALAKMGPVAWQQAEETPVAPIDPPGDSEAGEESGVADSEADPAEAIDDEAVISEPEAPVADPEPEPEPVDTAGNGASDPEADAPVADPEPVDATDEDTTETEEGDAPVGSDSDPIEGDMGTSSIGVGVVPIGQPAPVIVEFSATEGLGDVWIFVGEVLHPLPWTLSVVFGGLLAGHSTSVYVDGTFNYSLILAPGTTGIVSAQAFASAGVYSNIAYAWIT
jgi:hypothetical protein